MEIAKILLSSAVIVAIINVFQQSKSNKLKYITDERAEWRSCLKKIVVDIETANSETIKIPLTELKLNINYYGNLEMNSISKEKINVFKDQHIWETIHLLEKCCDNEPDKFEEYKKRLVDYIGFLLKFDWERSKYETKSDYSILVSIVLIMASAISVLVEYYTKNIKIDIWNVLQLCGVFIMPSVFSWIPVMIQKVEVMRTRNWYRDVEYMLALWLSSLVFYIIISLITQYELKLDVNIWSFLYFCSFVCSVCYISNERHVYIEYSNALNTYMSLDNVIIYYKRMSLSLLRTFMYFNKFGIEFCEEELKSNTLDLKIFESAENKEDKTLVKFVKNVNEKEKSIYDYMSKFNNRNKYIIKYKKDGKIYLTVGRNKKIWDNWFRQ